MGRRVAAPVPAGRRRRRLRQPFPVKFVEDHRSAGLGGVEGSKDVPTLTARDGSTPPWRLIPTRCTNRAAPDLQRLSRGPDLTRRAQTSPTPVGVTSE